MITRDMTLLAIVEKYPQTESLIREYDSEAGVCLLCQNLFDTLETIVREYGISLDALLDKLNAVVTKQ